MKFEDYYFDSFESFFFLKGEREKEREKKEVG